MTRAGPAIRILVGPGNRLCRPNHRSIPHPRFQARRSSSYASFDLERGVAFRCDIDAEPSLIEPGRIYTYAIDMFATSYVVPAGHRLRLEVTSSCFNRYGDNTPDGGQRVTPVAGIPCAYGSVIVSGGAESGSDTFWIPSIAPHVPVHTPG